MSFLYFQGVDANILCLGGLDRKTLLGYSRRSIDESATITQVTKGGDCAAPFAMGQENTNQPLGLTKWSRTSLCIDLVLYTSPVKQNNKGGWREK